MARILSLEDKKEDADCSYYPPLHAKVCGIAVSFMVKEGTWRWNNGIYSSLPYISLGMGYACCVLC